MLAATKNCTYGMPFKSVGYVKIEAVLGNYIYWSS